VAIQKLYLHDAATGNTGTLPSGKQSATTDAQSSTPTGKNTQRSMDGTAGSSQTSASWSTLANTSAQPTMLRMFESGPLAAQTIAAGNWQLSMAGIEANANANLHFTACVYVWRPSTGALVGSRIFDTTAASTGEPGTSEAAVSDATISGGSVTTAAGDILVCEIWRDATTQGNGIARACQFFYDGTTEASTSTNAAFLLAPASILEQSDPVNVLFDASASSSVTSNRNLAFNHTCGAAATKLYVAVVMGLTNDINQTVTVTYDTVSMSDIGAGQVHADSVTNGYVQVFELDNPTTGAAKSVSISITGGGTPGSLIGGAWSYAPASGFTLQTGTPASTSTTSPTTPITTNLTTTAGNRVAGAIGTGSSGEAALLTQVFLVNVNNSTGAGNGAAEDGYAPGGTTAVGFSVADDAALIAWEIQAVSSGASVTADVAASSTATITAAATGSRLAAASRSTTATITPAMTAAEQAAASRSNTATITATMTAAESAAAARNTTATITAAGTYGQPAAAAVASTATITPAMTAAESGAAAVSTAATITASATITTGQIAADVAASSTATITAAMTAAELAAAARSATATITATMTAAEQAAAAVASVATITAAGTGSRLAASAVASQAAITAAAAAAASVAAAVSTAATITAAADVTTGLTGTPGSVAVSNRASSAAAVTSAPSGRATVSSAPAGTAAVSNTSSGSVTIASTAAGAVTIGNSP
jgi:hypothetical protein